MGTIAAEISALRGRIDIAYDHIALKGGTVPAETDSWHLSSAIDSIPTGGGGTDPAAIVPVRYLKSTGTQYIDTEAYIANTAASRPRIEIDYQFDSYSSNVRLWGALSSTTSAPYCQLYINGGSSPQTAGFQFSTTRVVEYTPNTDRHSIVFDMLGDKASLDGSISSFTTSNRPVDFPALPYNVYLFGRNLNGEANALGDGKIYRYRHMQGANVIRDMIPVRKGDVGYMYDLASGYLFGNKGTGAFSYGLDMIPALSAATPVEYIQSTGTQYIDTFIDANTPLSVEMKFAYTSLQGNAIMLGALNTSLLTTQALNVIGQYPQGQFVTRCGSTSQSYGTLAANTAYTLNANFAPPNLTITIDGNTLFQSTSIVEQKQGVNLFLFATCRNAEPNFYATGRIYYAKFWRNGTLIGDFTPVRIGTTGYLYDRVSQTLFSNTGTGDFTLGPDVG